MMMAIPSLAQNGIDESQQKSLEKQTKTENFKLPRKFNVKTISSEETQGIPIDNSAGNGNSRPASDSDGDGLSDTEEGRLKTNPRRSDTDGDGLLDGWEVNITNGIDLRSMGASPLHKDIFVEMDYMNRSTAANGLGPNANVINLIQQAFAAAPVANPDNKSGINIHLITGNEVPYESNLQPYQDKFFALKDAHFDNNRAPFFHYMIWANAYSGGTSSGVSMSIPHSDFIVTLGAWNNNNGGTDMQKAGTFIHELGHNLGLMHGGCDHVNYKPNHVSVMNYSFQMSGVPLVSGRLHTYQAGTLPRINELSLQESNGLNGSTMPRGDSTRYYTIGRTIRQTVIGSPIDWNGNTVTDKEDIQVDINSDGKLTELLGSPNEWDQIIFVGGTIGQPIMLAGILDEAKAKAEIIPIVELTEEENNRINVK